MPTDNVMLYSGGLDSTVLLYTLKPNVKALLVNYGQRHVKELVHAQAVCHSLNIDYSIARLDGINHLIHKGSQAGRVPVPEGHYAEESMKATIAPNRNMLMLSIAVAHAITIGATDVHFACHAGDHAIYPDCRPEFVHALNEAIRIGNAWSPVYLHAPFVNLTKAEIVKLGASNGVPFADTWSCYKGEAQHCGRCSTCVERREAFDIAEVKDPTQYEDKDDYYRTVTSR